MIWIATQDDKSLVNVKEITVNGKKIEGVLGSATMDYWSKNLGKYESTERAIEVLKDIFTKLEESQSISVTYKMPKS